MIVLSLKSYSFFSWVSLRYTQSIHVNKLVCFSFVNLSVITEVSARTQKSSVKFRCSVMSDSLQPHGLQHTRPPCPSPTPGVYSNSCPLSWWCHPTISSSVIPFSSCPQSFPASGSFPISQLFASGGQNIGVSASASILPVNIQDWFPLGWIGWISLKPSSVYTAIPNSPIIPSPTFPYPPQQP